MDPEDGKTRVTTSVHGSFTACRLSKYAQKQRILRRVNGRIPSQPTGEDPFGAQLPQCIQTRLPAAPLIYRLLSVEQKRPYFSLVTAFGV